MNKRIMILKGTPSEILRRLARLTERYGPKALMTDVIYSEMEAL